MPPAPSSTHITFTAFDVPSDLRWSTVWSHEDGTAWAETARDAAAFFVRIRDFAEFRITTSDVQVSARPTARESTIRHLLLDQVLPLALAAEGHLVLHASAVHRDEMGIVALAGTAGAGKSTLAAALGSEGWRVVSDDGLWIVPGDGAPIAVPSYAGLRVWPDAIAAAGLEREAVAEVAEYSAKLRVSSKEPPPRGPLRAVYVIDAGRECRFDRLGPRDAVMALVEHAYRADPNDGEALAAQLDTCATLAAHVPVSRVVVPRDLAYLRQTARRLDRHARVGRID